MVARFVVGISPLLQSRNSYLPSIGWKGRVPGGCARKTERKYAEIEIKNKNENKQNPSAHKVMGYAPRPCIQLLEKPKDLQVSKGNLQ